MATAPLPWSRCCSPAAVGPDRGTPCWLAPGGPGFGRRLL